MNVTKINRCYCPVPWTGRTIVEEKCDEVEGHLTYLTKSEESLIKKSCVFHVVRC